MVKVEFWVWRNFEGGCVWIGLLKHLATVCRSVERPLLSRLEMMLAPGAGGISLKRYEGYAGLGQAFNQAKVLRKSRTVGTAE